STAYLKISTTDGDMLMNNIYYADLEEYNNDLSVLLSTFSNDYDRVVVEIRRRNGTSSRPHKPSFTVILKSSNTSQTTMQVTPAQPTQDAMGNGFMGLNAPDIMNAFSSQRENELLKQTIQQLTQDLNTTKADRDRLLSENHELKIKTNLHSYQIENSKPSAIDKLIEALASNPSALVSAVSLLGNRGAGTPLNAAKAAELNGAKALLQEVAETHPEAYCAIYVQVINKLNEDKEFADFVKEKINPKKL